MADILPLHAFAPQPDLEGMSREGLTALLEDVRAELAALDAAEPEDMESPAYEDWGEQHEALEDLADEIMDLLDEQEG